MARVGVAAGVTQHMRVDLELEAGAGGALDHPGKARGRERGAALTDEDEGRRRALPLEPARGPHLVGCDTLGGA
jgi:hypothetical protein